jgi:predicted nucleic-acid-binding protein
VKGLDTNTLVRFLVNDDTNQAARVKNLFEASEQSGAMLLISTPVVLELLWVLAAVYACSRPVILNALEELSMLPFLRFENPDLIHQLISTGRGTDIDLADILIGLAARHLNCDTTITFDRKAANSSLFELL